MRALIIMLTVLPMVACTRAAAPPEPDKTSIEQPLQTAPEVPVIPLLHAGGFGPLVIGMTRDEVIAAAGAPDEPRNEIYESEACETFSPANYPEIEVMIEEGKLTRVTLDSDKFLTDKNLGVNSAADEIKAAYGPALIVDPHKYADAPAEYLTFWSVGDGTTPDSRGLRYETDEESKTAFVHGGGPSIQYVEGCL